MMNAENRPLTPDWLSPPGNSILAALFNKNMSLDDLADRCEIEQRDMRNIVLGSKQLDEPVACKLSQSLGASPEFWLKRQADYEESVQRCVAILESDNFVSIVDTLPLKDMRMNGWVPGDTSRIQGVVEFFGVRNLKHWQETFEKKARAVAFRQSDAFEDQSLSTLVWLRQAERAATLVNCKPWDRNRFLEVLTDIRSLTRKKDPAVFCPLLVQKCAECGVAVVFVKAPKGCRASGATMFVDENKAMIVLSFRHLSDDHFWFSFFHEAGHLVLHDEKALFLEDASLVTQTEENEADAFASELLVPSSDRPEMESLPGRAKPIIRFALRIGVSPGIVVGQMQHARVLNFKQMNALKRRFSWQQLSSTF